MSGLTRMIRRVREIELEIKGMGVEKKNSPKLAKLKADMYSLAAKIDKEQVDLARNIAGVILSVCMVIGIVFLYATVQVLSDKSVLGLGYLATATCGLIGFSLSIVSFVFQTEDNPYPDMLMNFVSFAIIAIMLTVYHFLYLDITSGSIRQPNLAIYLLPLVTYAVAYSVFSWVGWSILHDLELGEYYKNRHNRISSK